MKRKLQFGKIGISPVFRILLGALFCFAVTVLVLAAVSLGTKLMRDPTPRLPFLSLGAFLIAGILSSAILARKSGRALYGFLCPLLFLVIFLVAGLIGSKGHLSGSVLLSDGAFLLASAVGALCGGRKKKRKRPGRAHA